MKKLLVCSSTILFILIIDASLICQCKCSLEPITNKILKVNTVTELKNALIESDLTNGETTIIISKGEYLLNSNLRFIGSNISKLKILGATGNRNDVIIKGQGFSGNVTHIFNVAAAYFYLADVTIGWVSQHPIQIHGELGAHYPIIQNVKIVDGNEQFIKISADLNNKSITHCIGGLIECCYFEFTNGIANQYYTGGIDGHKCENWVIRNNTFTGIRSPDNNLSEHAIHFWSDSREIVVEQNQINNCDRGIGFGLGSDTSRGTKGGIIRNNFIHTNRDVGIGLENASGVKVLNNTLWTDNYFNSIEYRFINSQRISISNNLCNQKISQRDGAIAVLNMNYEQARTDFFMNASKYDYHINSIAVKEIGFSNVLLDVPNDIDCETRSTPSYVGADQISLSNMDIATETIIGYSIFNNLININCEICKGVVKIFNLSGLEIFTKEFESNSIIIPKEIDGGIFLINLQIEKNRIIEKIIINK